MAAADTKAATKTVLILSDVALQGDRRVEAGYDAYAKQGFSPIFVNVRKTSFKMVPTPGRLIRFLWAFWLFNFQVIFHAFCVLPKFNRIWKSRDLARYKLRWIRTPLVYWYETVVHYYRGFAYMETHGDFLGKLDAVHANDLAALSFIQPLKQYYPDLVLSYDAHELSPLRNRISISWLSAWLVTAWESKGLDVCENIISVSPPILAWLRLFKKNSQRRVRFQLICNNFYNAPDKPLTQDESGPISMIYIGSMIKGRGLSYLIELSKVWPDLNLHLFCPTINPMQQKRIDELQGIHDLNIHIGPYQEDLLEIISKSKATFGWLALDDYCLSYRFAMPNKLFQYAALNIIPVYREGVTYADILRSMSAGIALAKHEAVSALKDQMLAFDAKAHQTISAEVQERFPSDAYKHLAQNVDKMISGRGHSTLP